MSPFVGYHATAFRHRNSIHDHGLVPGSSNKWNSFGVYVFRDDCGHPTFARAPGACRWSWQPPSDLWQVAFIGPIEEDHYVENGYVFRGLVPPAHLKLVEGEMK